MESALADLFGRIGDLDEARGVTLRVCVTTGETLPSSRAATEVVPTWDSRCRSAPARVWRP